MKIDTSKLELMPVPDGMIMRIRHITEPEELELHRRPHAENPPARATMASLISKKDGVPVHTAVSLCSSRDQVNKKLGRIIAHNRCVRGYLRNPLYWADKALPKNDHTYLITNDDLPMGA